MQSNATKENNECAVAHKRKNSKEKLKEQWEIATQLPYL